MCLSDEEFVKTNGMTLDQIKIFLGDKDSFLRGDILDVDGSTINPATLILNAAQTSQINPQVILTTLEKEQGAIRASSRLRDNALRFLAGYDPNNTVVPKDKKSIREQIADVAAQFRRDFDRLGKNQPTVGGWQVGVGKLSHDEVIVTPASKTVAVLFSYTPEVGEGWGGGMGVGGNCLFCNVWKVFGFLKTSGVKFYFEGTVKSIGGAGYEVPSFKVGDKFWGTYNVDLSTPDSIPSDVTYGNYFGAVSNLVVHVGAYTPNTSGPWNLQVGNDVKDNTTSYDYYSLEGAVAGGPDIGNWTPTSFILQLVDRSHTAFSSDALPRIPPSPENFVDLYTYLGLTFKEKTAGYNSQVVAEFERHYLNP